jgi:hypothetical protein
MFLFNKKEKIGLMQFFVAWAKKKLLGKISKGLGHLRRIIKFGIFCGAKL